MKMRYIPALCIVLTSKANYGREMYCICKHFGAKQCLGGIKSPTREKGCSNSKSQMYLGPRQSARNEKLTFIQVELLSPSYDRVELSPSAPMILSSFFTPNSQL